MGAIAARLRERKSTIGWPNVGWQPISGWYGPTASGITVTQETAFTVAAFYAGVRVIAEDVAGLPLILYRRGADGRSKDRATEHPLYPILHDAPNPEMTAIVFRETLMAHLLTWGNAYAEKELDGLGRTMRLWPLRPDRMTVTTDDAGKRVYEYQVRPGSGAVRLPAARVFHVPGLGFDGLIGYSILKLARETLANTVALREYGSRVLANDARPGVILTHPKTLSDKARQNLKTSWEANHGGFTNAGRTAILEEGMTVTTLGLPREDVLFLTSAQWQVTEVARWLRLAPHKIGDLSRATFSNIEEQSLDHASTLRPWCVRWEQQIGKDLITEPDLFAEHLMDAAFRGRTLERFQAYQMAVQNMAMTPNEWRQYENWNPVPWGDEPVRTPNNSAAPPAQEAPDAEAEPPDTEEPTP